jgi:DnaK suppressor protein
MSRGFRDADTSQQMSAQETSEAIRHVQAAAEEQAQHAADVRDQGGYGKCEVCGGEIGEERLAAVPDATRCISCQTSWESR